MKKTLFVSVFFALCSMFLLNAAEEESKKDGGTENKAAAPLNPFADIDASIEKLNKEIEKAKDSKKLDKLNEQLKKEQVKKDQRLAKLEKEIEPKLEKLKKDLEAATAKNEAQDKIKEETAKLEKQLKDILSWYKGVPPAEGKKSGTPATGGEKEEKADPKDFLKKVL